MQQEVLKKLEMAESVLIALPSNPQVDELATAIGLSLIIDKMNKRVTTIYSGVTPNALSFLRPEETFDNTTVSLQDFVIAINKEKADHLRYKVEGDYVKVYITPYKTSIRQDDLEFSYGDFNVDLVIALNVDNEGDLDGALMEYGRILHNAVIVNITNEPENKFGDVVMYGDGVSSLGEMAYDLIEKSQGKMEIDADIATALLTGIVAKTNRFSNELTNPNVMMIAGKLMAEGADQQLISANMTDTTDMAEMNVKSEVNSDSEIKTETDPSSMSINHEPKTEVEPKKVPEEKAEMVSNEQAMNELKKSPLIGQAKTEMVLPTVQKQRTVVQEPEPRKRTPEDTPKPVMDAAPKADAKADAGANADANTSANAGVDAGVDAGTFRLPMVNTQTESKDDVIASILAKAEDKKEDEEASSPEVKNIIDGIKKSINDVNVDKVVDEAAFMGNNPALVEEKKETVNEVGKEKIETPEEEYLNAPEKKLEQPKALKDSRVVIRPTGKGIEPSEAVKEASVEISTPQSVLPMPGADTPRPPEPPPLSL